MHRYVQILAALVLLTSCGSDPARSNAQAGTIGTSVATNAAPAELGTLKEAGLGQAGQYVWATAIVHNNSTYVGQTVTVNFNVLDASGGILASESQVESFSQPEADHIIGTQISLDKGAKAAKVEATLDVKAAGAFSDQPFPRISTSNYKIGKGELGDIRVTFELSNPLSQALKAPRIGIVCRNSGGAIIGGGNSFPELVPAKGRIKVDAGILVSATPTKCSAFVGAPSDWAGTQEGTSSTGSQPAAQASNAAVAGTAQAAFKVWVDQFTSKNWSGQYATLLSAQRELISLRQYKACRSKDALGLKWVKVLSVQDAGATPVPGTKLKLPSTKVTAQVSANGIKVPVDAHMFMEDGAWKWTMTQENLDGCSA